MVLLLRVYHDARPPERQISVVSRYLPYWTEKKDSNRAQPTYKSEVLQLERSDSVPVSAHQSVRRHMSEECNPEAVRTSHLTI